MQDHRTPLNLSIYVPLKLLADRNIHFRRKEDNRRQCQANKSQLPSHDKSPNDSKGKHSNCIKHVPRESPKDVTHFLAAVDKSRCNHRRLSIISKKPRSEEHTSELQSQFHLVCRLLLE